MAGLLQRVVRADAIQEGDKVGRLGPKGYQLVGVRAAAAEHPAHAAAREQQASGTPAEEVLGSAPQAVVLYVDEERDGTQVSPSDLVVVWR